MQLLGNQEQGAPLAEPGAGDPSALVDAAHTQLLIVEVAELRCALPAAAVIELHQMVATVPLPAAVTGVDGVIDRRGSLVVVLDLRARMGLPTRPPRVTDHLVVVRLAGGPVALRVDRAGDLVVLPAAEVATAASLPGEESLHGAARLPDGLVLIYDVESFLSPEDAAVVAAAMQQMHGVDQRPHA